MCFSHVSNNSKKVCNYCEKCYELVECKEFYVDSLYDIFHRFHSKKDKLGIKFENAEELFEFCSPVESFKKEIQKKIQTTDITCPITEWGIPVNFTKVII
jgi:DNA-binding PucR family transcriptional regulator